MDDVEKVEGIENPEAAEVPVEAVEEGASEEAPEAAEPEQA